MKDLVTQLLNSGEMIEIEYGDNSLSDAGIVEFSQYCRKNDIPQPPWHIIGSEWEESNPDALYQGKLMSRYERFVRDQYGRFKIPDLGTISSKLKDFVNEKGQVKFQFTKTIDWENGEFGEKSLFNGALGSCLWTVKPGALDMIRKNGFAICFFNMEGSPKGRCWGYVTPDDEFIIFNGYGFESSNNTRAIAKILSWWLQVPYTRIQLRNLGKEFDRGELYINNGEGFIIGKSQLEFYDLNWAEIKKLRCESCNRVLLGVDDGDTVMTGDHYSYCVPCSDRELGMCYETLELYHKSTLLIGPDNNNYCRSAFHQLFGYCEVTGNHYPYSELVELSEGRWILKARQNDFFFCESCRNVRDIKDMREENKEVICLNCVRYNKTRKKAKGVELFSGSWAIDESANEIRPTTLSESIREARSEPSLEATRIESIRRDIGRVYFDAWYFTPRMPFDEDNE